MKETKLPIPWSSKVPKRYKRNVVVGDLHRTKRIGFDFDQEVTNIKMKYRKADFPQRYVNSIIRKFYEEQQKTTDPDSFLIPPGLFNEEEDKGFLLVEIPFCEKKELLSKTFLKKFDAYTNSRFRVSIKWLTKKTKTLFPLKDRNTLSAKFMRVCALVVSRTWVKLNEMSNKDGANTALHTILNQPIIWKKTQHTLSHGKLLMMLH